VSGVGSAGNLAEISESLIAATQVSPNLRCDVDGEAKPLCNATVLEPKQVIDFVQLASLVRVGISDNSGKTSKPS